MQGRKNFEIELSPEFRVLIGSPFVEHQQRTLLELSHDQSQPPALAARQVRGSKLAVRQVGFFMKLELRQHLHELRRVRIVDAVQALKQVEIGKDRGDEA